MGTEPVGRRRGVQGHDRHPGCRPCAEGGAVDGVGVCDGQLLEREREQGASRRLQEQTGLDGQRGRGCSVGGLDDEVGLDLLPAVGQGRAERVVRSLAQRAQTDGAPAVYLEMFADNEAARTSRYAR